MLPGGTDVSAPAPRCGRLLFPMPGPGPRARQQANRKHRPLCIAKGGPACGGLNRHARTLAPGTLAFTQPVLWSMLCRTRRGSRGADSTACRTAASFLNPKHKFETRGSRSRERRKPRISSVAPVFHCAISTTRPRPVSVLWWFCTLGSYFSYSRCRCPALVPAERHCSCSCGQSPMGTSCDTMQ